ncbi:hypothetical protein [Actinomadura hibisca]|uniref:hypothetical protein n=1 Tax=Actinomadura hibisca TaxID=68565 RepID=UPI0008309F56|nr:hypothetical protein [Actinomadura hibisca]
MQIRFLGKETSGGDSPTLYATDRQTYLIQGYKVTDPEILAKLDIPEGETCVEIYARLLAHLSKDGLHGVVTSWAPPIVHVLENGNYLVQGPRVTDPAIRAELALPDNEDCIEVPREALRALLEENDRGVDDA